MNIRAGFEIGTKHMTTKGQIEIINHEERMGIIWTTYTLNGETLEKKFTDVFKNVYYYMRKTNGTLPQRGMSRRTRQTVTNAVAEIEYSRKLKFGIELEVIVPDKYDLIRKLEAKGVPVKTPNSTHQVLNNAWKVVYDGSINAPGGWDGCEIVSPPSTNFDQLKLVCEALKEVGAKANSSCGFHVHHDIKEYKRKQIMRIYNFYSKYETYIDMLHKKSRENNRFAKCVSGYLVNRVNECETKEQLLRSIAGKGNGAYYNNCRYYKVNLRSYLYYGTIEFRQHAGTVKYEEITNWINFTHKIIERGLEIDNDVVYPTNEQKQAWNENKKNAFTDMFKELHIENTTLSKYIEKKTARRIA